MTSQRIGGKDFSRYGFRHPRPECDTGTYESGWPDCRCAGWKGAAVTRKEALHRLIEELPPRDVEAVTRFAEYLRIRSLHPAIRAALSAPPDDAQETAEEATAVREAPDDLEQGQVLSDEDLVV